MSRYPRRTALLVLVCLSALWLEACGDTLQNRPVAARTLESLVLVDTSPVYWLGRSFGGHALSEVSRDPGGAFTLQYGDCTVGGQSSCVYPLAIVTSPDNSFRPGGELPQRSVALRGVRGLASRQGRTLTLTTGGVTVSIYASSASLARAAASTMVTINRLGTPGARLPTALADTGFARTPLAAQRPPLIRGPRQPRRAGSGGR